MESMNATQTRTKKAVAKEQNMKFKDLTTTTTTEGKLILIMPGGEKLIIEGKRLSEALEELVAEKYPLKEEAEGTMDYLEELSWRFSDDFDIIFDFSVRQELRALENSLDFELFWVEDDFYEKGINESSKEERHYFSRITNSQSERELW